MNLNNEGRDEKFQNEQGEHASKKVGDHCAKLCVAIRFICVTLVVCLDAEMWICALCSQAS